MTLATAKKSPSATIQRIPPANLCPSQRMIVADLPRGEGAGAISSSIPQGFRDRPAGRCPARLVGAFLERGKHRSAPRPMELVEEIVGGRLATRNTVVERREIFRFVLSGRIDS